MSNINQLSGAIKFALFVGATASLATASAFAQDSAKKDEPVTTETVQVTGSRIKRVNAEDATPITVITREEIDRSGDTSVADVLRNSTFSSAGNFRPQSGSSAQALADIDLRGIGSNRTLVLIDGRRAPKAPFSGQSADLNAIPLAAVERIEILSDGASAIYGSDAIGGVVNVILRKDFNGAEFKYGISQPTLKGGETTEAAAVVGISGDRGSMMAGVSYNDRDIIFTRDRPWGATPGASTYSNTWQAVSPSTGGPTGARNNFPTFACNTNGFYINASGLCVYNFNLQAADEAAIGNRSLFARGDYEINDNWTAYMTASVSRVESFGRYAPAPVDLFVPDGTPNDINPVVDNPATPGIDEGGMWVRHRFAAGGNRDNNTDANVYDVLIGFKGTIGSVDFDAGIRRNEYKYFERGNGYVVIPLLEAAVNSGAYDLLDPFGNSQATINSVKTTTARNSAWSTREIFASADFDLFAMGAGTAQMAVGAEYRTEDYADIYDSLSSSGVVAGSSGNSAFGGRSISSAYAEVLLPFFSTFDITLAGRFDRYSDYGSDFAPKVAMRWQPLENLVFRASYGEGFAAPTLDILTQQPAFSADPVFDVATCLADGNAPAACNSAAGVELQINGLVIANPNLSSEQSKQYALGVAWDATDWLNMSLDYNNITINDRIVQFSAQTLVDRDLDPSLGPTPPGLGVTRDPITGAITQVIRGSANEGDLKTDSFDLNIRTRFDFNAWGKLENQLTLSNVRSYTIDGGTNLVGSQGLPKQRAVLQNVWTKGDFAFAWNANFIGKQTDLGAVNYSVTTHDLQAVWSAPWDGKLAFGVNNIENQLPQLVSAAGRPFNFALYDAYGRQYYLRYTQSF